MDSPAAADVLSEAAHQSPWQFGLRKLLVLVAAVAIWCAMASWSLAWANVFGVAAVYLTGLIVLARRKSRWVVAWAIAFGPLGVVMCYMPALLHENATIAQATFTLEVLVKDATTGEPIPAAPVEWWADGTSISDTTASNGTSSILASFPARRRNQGWGRSSYEVDLSDVSVFVSVPDYEATHINWAQQTGHAYTNIDDTKLLTLEILLKPVPSILDEL